MDLSKFLWLIQNNALYFSRLDSLGDPYEGYYTRNNPKAVEAYFGGQVDARVILDFSLRLRQNMFVSCWHTNREESAAMWKLYTSHSQSVCIRSSYEKLAQVLPEQCHLGMVSYIDYEEAVISPENLFNFTTHKRKSFEHEKEIRAIYQHLNFGPTKADGHRDIIPDERLGVVIPVDLTNLITEVLVSPEADGLLFEVVSTICEREGLLVPVTKSGVNAPPAH